MSKGLRELIIFVIFVAVWWIPITPAEWSKWALFIGIGSFFAAVLVVNGIDAGWA